MKVVILADGLGTRSCEETQVRRLATVTAVQPLGRFAALELVFEPGEMRDATAAIATAVREPLQ